MKTSTILLSVALAFKTIYTKAIDNGVNIKSSQLAVIKNDINLEIINGKNFTYKYHCNDDKDERKYCEGIKNDLDYAFKALSNTFEFYQPIVFETFVEDLTLNYNLSDVLAVAMDLNFVPLKLSDDPSSAPLLYPQALAKQLNLVQEPEYKKNDFVLIINNCNSLPLYNDNERRSLLIHELLHGFGFLNSISFNTLADDDISEGSVMKLTFYKEEDNYILLPRVIPLYNNNSLDFKNADEYMDQLASSSKIDKFFPPLVFDKYIISIETGEKLYDSFQFLYDELNQKCLPQDDSSLVLKDLTNKFIKECYEKLKHETQEIISRIPKDYFFKTNTLGILTKNGDIVPLQTLNNVFIPGSSICHPSSTFFDKFGHILIQLLYSPFEIDQTDPLFIELFNSFDQSTGFLNKDTVLKYYDGNFVLYMADYDSFTVEEMLETVAKNNKYGLIGDDIVKVLKTIGWTEKGEKRSNETYIVDENISIPETNSFEYLYMKKYEAMNQFNNTSVSIPEEKQINDVQITSVVNEVQTTLADVEDSEIDVDVEITDSPNDESDFDSDVEEKQ